MSTDTFDTFFMSDGGAGATGLSFTAVTRHLDGTAADTATVAEIDASNAPGWYKITLDNPGAPAQPIVWSAIATTALSGDSGIRSGRFDPPEVETHYVPWYQIRMWLRDESAAGPGTTPEAVIQRIGDGKYYHADSAQWEVGAPTLGTAEAPDLTETSVGSGIYEYTLPFAAVSDDAGRFNGHDGYRVRLRANARDKHLIIYPMDAGYDVWASIHRGGTVPILPMTGEGLRVLHQKVQWDRALGGTTGATVKATIRRVSDGKAWSTTSGGEWLALGSQTDPTLTAVDATNTPGLYEYTVPESALDHEIGREGYDVITYDTGLQIDHLVRYMPTGSLSDPANAARVVSGSFAEALRAGADKLYTRIESVTTGTVNGETVVTYAEIAYYTDDTYATEVLRTEHTPTYDAGSAVLTASTNSKA